MIKRYNQFVKGKVNEDYEIESEIESPVRELPLDEEPPINTPIDMESEFEGEEEEIAKDKYEIALQDLADAAGVEFNTGDKMVVIGDKKVTFPAETEKYHIDGVKKSFSTVDDVLSNLGGAIKTPTEVSSEVSDEMSSIKDEEFLDKEEQFESKSYKSKSYKK
jgi:hypothetical protein